MQHEPVLLSEVLQYLNPQKGQVIVDGTFGFGGHAIAIARKIGQKGQLVGIEQDERTLKMVRTKITASNIKLKQGNFAELPKILHDRNITSVDGILLDLGVSSWQLASPEHGLSWQNESSLDMRLSRRSADVGIPTSNVFNGTSGGDGQESVKTLIKRLSEKELADILYRLADERQSRVIARAIKEHQNKLETTTDLANLIAKTVGRHGKLHPATRTFMALRLLVNHELENLDQFMKVAPSCLKANGRLVIISFHSGEDRIVKHAFKDKELWQVLTKKPVVPTREEAIANPRSRSAKLRAAIKIDINSKHEARNQKQIQNPNV
jgi:16S rRNA (cytosine1402-N4)-methyltransferase